MIDTAKIGELTVTRTDRSDAGNWLVSGTIKWNFKFHDGRPAVIETEFAKAPNDAAAIRQCAERLKALADAMQFLALQHL